MTRTYSLGKRAEKQAGTRQRIVEAAVELHGTVGPAATTVSQIAERAGVQRHTFYAHFPQDRDLHLACSGHFFATNPMPDPEPWRAIPDLHERLRTGLAEIYAWYESNEGLLSCVLRDAEHHALTQEMGELRMGPPMRAIRDVLREGLDPDQRALLGLALSFHGWRNLAREGGLRPEAAADLMAGAIVCGDGA